MSQQPPEITGIVDPPVMGADPVQAGFGHGGIKAFHFSPVSVPVNVFCIDVVPGQGPGQTGPLTVPPELRPVVVSA